MENKSFLPIEFQVKTFCMTAQLGMNLDEAHKQQILQINELDEIRQDALQKTMLIHNQRKTWHHKFIKQKQFNTRVWALLFESWLKILKEN